MLGILHPLEIVPRYHDPQLQVGEKFNYNITNKIFITRR